MSEAEVGTRRVIESILLLADEPVPARVMGEVLEVPQQDVTSELQRLADAYVAEQRGFVLREVAGGWRLYTAPECAPWLERFVRGRARTRLTGAALEVLAVLVYRGPLSRTQVSEIRGVESDGVIRTLLARGLVEEVGRQPGVGSPILLAPTAELVERLGLASLEDLPPLSDFMPDAEAVEEMESRLSPGA
jgi:segregation and condensation protein B